MPVGSNQMRHCLIDQNGGNLTVLLYANKALRAGADFKLFEDNSGDSILNFKMAAGDTGVGSHELSISMISNKSKLVWQILCCSLVSTIDSGMVAVQILQNGVPCPMTKSAQWDLTGVPDCRTGEAIPINASLIFLYK